MEIIPLSLISNSIFTFVECCARTTYSLSGGSGSLGVYALDSGVWELGSGWVLNLLHQPLSTTLNLSLTLFASEPGLWLPYSTYFNTRFDYSLDWWRSVKKFLRHRIQLSSQKKSTQGQKTTSYDSLQLRPNGLDSVMKFGKNLIEVIDLSNPEWG